MADARARGRNVHFEPDAFIARSGDPADAFYALRSLRIAIDVFIPQRGPLSTDLTRKIESAAKENGGKRVKAVAVRLGALSHFSAEHFREHFDDVARGTATPPARIQSVLNLAASRPVTALAGGAS